VAAVLVTLALLWVAFLLWVPIQAWNGVQRVDASPASGPAAGKGYNYLLVGSDSREGLTPEQAAAIGTDNTDVGKRTDSIMIVHLGSGGSPAIVSIPRDSYVAIAGHGTNKINASYAFGGAKLLTDTVQQLTGLRLDGYLEIGFGGFASMVDALGGVDICVPAAMKDDMAGLDVQAGCQSMDGKVALAYVRARHSDPRGDLGRAERQRQFLSAVIKKAATPGTVLVPGKYKGFADSMSKGLVVGDGTSLSDAVRILQAMRSIGNGDGVTTQLPVENPAYATKNAGSAVKLNDAALKAMCTKLRNDEPLTAPAG
jgi:LCP family protein required for cell wall assembly